MRHELRRRLNTIARSLHELKDENAHDLARRLHDGTAEAWLAGEHGEHVWIEVGATLRALRSAAAHLPLRQRAAVIHGERAWGEAETLLTHRSAGLVVVARAA